MIFLSNWCLLEKIHVALVHYSNYVLSIKLVMSKASEGWCLFMCTFECDNS